MSDNKKKRIGKVFVPQKPSKAHKDLIELIKGSVLQKLPKDLIEPVKGFVLQKPSKAPKDLIDEPVKGFVPPDSPKPPPKNYKMP